MIKAFILSLGLAGVLAAQCTPQYDPLQGKLICAIEGSSTTGTVTSVGLVGTANQITVTGASPITSSGSWTLSFAAGATANLSPLTTKGDLWGFSSSNTRLGVGTDGQFLSSDSSQALGLKWVTAGQTTTVSPTFTSIGDGNCQSQNTTWTGIGAGAAISVGPPAAFASGLFVTAVVTAADTVQLRVCNLSGSAVNPGTATYTLGYGIGVSQGGGGGGSSANIISGSFVSGNVAGSCSLVLTTTSFTSNAGCSDTALTGGLQSGSSTASNGWACTLHDLATPASIWGQSATSTTTITFLAPGVSTTGDTVNFTCTGY